MRRDGMTSSESLSSYVSLSSSSSIRTDSVPATGLTVLVEPAIASVDIVFVHGFTGHPERTWTSKRTTAPREVEEEHESARAPRFGRFLSPATSRGPANRAAYWPRDLLPTKAPHARVLTYGYDTNVRHRFMSRISKNTVYEIAADLLLTLTAARKDAHSRPVVFVAHSLGGILVKECLRRSRSLRAHQQQLAAVFNSTVGVIFFGTPHGAGPDPRGALQHVGELAIKSVGLSVSNNIVNSLRSTERLRELRDDFSLMAREQRWVIHSFQEQHGINTLGGNKVADDALTYLNDPVIEVRETITRNHMQMCRFASPQDPEFQKFAAALHRVLETPSGPSILPPTPIDHSSRLQHLQALAFPQMNVRETTVRSAHPGTCQWLLTKPELRDWLDNRSISMHRGFLWVMGGPGTGKSTAMKFLINHARVNLRNTIIATFYFNALGSDLEKSAAGMYRSLLHQILSTEPQLVHVLDALGSNPEDDPPVWELRTLLVLFRATLSKLGFTRLVCFIDGLDECEESGRRDVVAMFEQISALAANSNANIRICLSGRHRPHIPVQQYLHITLEAEQEHYSDIFKYLNAGLRIGHGQEEAEVRREVTNRSRGTFLWAVMAASSLNEAYNYDQMNALRNRLRMIPNDLGSIFRERLMRDHENRDAMVICFQWLLFCMRPLEVSELYFAICAGIPNIDPIPWDHEKQRIDDMIRYIVGISQGLVEVVPDDVGSIRVQFVHETVSDYLKSNEGLPMLLQIQQSALQGRSDDQICRSCVRYISAEAIDTFSLEPREDEPSDDSPSPAPAHKSIPLRDYAIHFMLEHAERAVDFGVPQYGQLMDIMQLSNAMLAEFCGLGRFSSSVVDMSKGEILLHACAERDLPGLIWSLKNATNNLDVINKLHTSPMIFALRAGSKRALAELLRPLADWQGMASPIQQTNSTYDFAAIEHHFDFASVGVEVDSQLHGITGHPTLLSWFVSNNNAEMVRVLLATDKVDVNVRHKNGKTPIISAVQNGSEEIFRLLVRSGKVNLRITYLGQNLLMMAAEGGHTGIVRMLLESRQLHINAANYQWRTALFYATGPEVPAEVASLLLSVPGIDVNARDLSEATPFFHAVANGNMGVAEMFLSIDEVDVNHKNSLGDTAVMVAAIYHDMLTSNTVDTVRMLLQDPRVDLNAKDARGRTLLSLAVEYNDVRLVQLLVENGRSDINSQDREGQTALHLAAAAGYPHTIEILKGAKQLRTYVKNVWGQTAMDLGPIGLQELG